MKFRFVLVVTYGRTGSTLLMGVLNSTKGISVRGENYDLCGGLFQSYKALVSTAKHRGASGGTKPFYGANLVDFEQFFLDARTLVANQLFGPVEGGRGVWGFKEIRYLNYGDSLGEYLDFLSRLFPEAAFVFLTRNSADVSNSAFWKTSNRDIVINKIGLFEEVARRWSARRDDCYWIAYEDLVGRAEFSIKGLFEFLHVPYDAARVRETLETEHSYGNEGRGAALGQGRMSARVVPIADESEIIFRLDKVPNNVQINVPFEIGGVALGIEMPVESVSINGALNVGNVQCGLSSPWYANRYTAPWAGNARFVVREIVIAPECKKLDFLIHFKGTPAPKKVGCIVFE